MRRVRLIPDDDTLAYKNALRMMDHIKRRDRYIQAFATAIPKENVGLIVHRVDLLMEAADRKATGQPYLLHNLSGSGDWYSTPGHYVSSNTVCMDCNLTLEEAGFWCRGEGVNDEDKGKYLVEIGRDVQPGDS